MKRRRAPRVRPSPSRPVEVQITGAGFMDVLNARDISELGIGVWVPHMFDGCDIDQAVEIVVTLPRHGTFVCRGSLMHRTLDGAAEFFGIHFADISENALKMLRGYVKFRMTESATSVVCEDALSY